MAAQTNKIPKVAQIHFPREDLGLSLRISSVTYNFSLLKNKIQWVKTTDLYFNETYINEIVVYINIILLVFVKVRLQKSSFTKLKYVGEGTFKQ